ncbi:MAG: MFS transporter, partial [Actinobacteria bacterium]|nr:MFS transporter [Actinomycetota bacterium]
DDLPNAISLNTIAIQTAAVAGPALGGLVIATKGVGWVYATNAVSFAFVLGALLMMKGAGGAHLEAQTEGARTRQGGNFSVKAALEGLRFVFRAPLIRSTMLLDFFATFFSSATALLPIFAQDVLHVGARGYGWLYAAPAVGAVLASGAMVRAVERIERRGTVLVGAVLTYGVATVAFGLSTLFWLTFACLAATGAADTVSMVFRNLIRQLETPDYLRGRMTGVNMIFFMGGPQLGELEAGLVANWLGPVVSVVTGGIGCLLATAWVASSTPALRAYRRSGNR